jgi:hypothetical protein
MCPAGQYSDAGATDTTQCDFPANCPLISCPPPQQGCSYVGAVYDPAGCNDATYAGGGTCCLVGCGTQDCSAVDQCAANNCAAYGFTDANGAAIASCAWNGDCMPEEQYHMAQAPCEAQAGQWCPADIHQNPY